LGVRHKTQDLALRVGNAADHDCLLGRGVGCQRRAKAGCNQKHSQPRPLCVSISVAERLTQERYNVSFSTTAAQTSCYPKRARRCAMESIQLWARDGEAVRQAIELGEMAHIETASEECTDEFLLFAIESGLLKTWANAFPDPRRAPEIGMEVILPAHLAARFAGLYSMRKAGYVLRSARELGALGYSVEGIDPAPGLYVREASGAKRVSVHVV